MTTYIGKVSEGQYIITVLRDGTSPRRLPPVIDGMNVQYADTFHWGSVRLTTGMHQAALAILTDYLTDGSEADEPENAACQALLLHQPFVALVVSRFQESWRLAEEDINNAVAQILVFRKEMIDGPSAEVEIVAARRRDLERQREEAEQEDWMPPTRWEFDHLLSVYWRHRLTR